MKTILERNNKTLFKHWDNKETSYRKNGDNLLEMKYDRKIGNLVYIRNQSWYFKKTLHTNKS